MCFTGDLCAFLLLALTLCQGPGHVQAKNDNYQMSDICKKYFMRDLYRKIDGAVLISQNERDLDCTITFQTHSILQRFMLRFDQLQLDCNDHLYIYDGAHAVSSYKICDKTVCPGPVRYYTDLGCTPIYTNPGDCCAEKYDCNFVKNLSKNKCYVNDHEYSFGEALRDEDTNPCDALCTCQEDYNAPGIGSFLCAGLDCGLIGPTSKCYNKHSHGDCCPGTYVCLKEGEERPTCEVDGIVYKDGEMFVSKSEPEKDCYCMAGYEGKNVEPFCKKPKRPTCSPLFRDAYAVHQNCAPIFYRNMVPQTDCNSGFICPNETDTVIHNHDSNESVSEEDSDICQFGDLILHIGDELDQKASPCIKCMCEAPPTLTCQELQTDSCNEAAKFPILFDSL